MDYFQIQDPTHHLVPTIQALYEQSFPERERREFSQVISLLAIKNMRLIVIAEALTVIGFFILWEFEEFIYLEHFAIDPLQRGKNYGSAIIEQIILSSRKFLLLEVEPDHDDTSKKRIRFYEKLGMKICPFEYEQPNYRKNEKPFPMLILSYPQSLSRKAFEQYVSIIKEKVYRLWR